MQRTSLFDAALDRAADALSRGLVNHVITVGTHRTSIHLDQPSWQALRDITEREGITVREFCTAIADQKPRHLSLTVAIRIGVLQYYMDATTERGQGIAGHGKIGRLH